jgi:hypothetical protein
MVYLLVAVAKQNQHAIEFGKLFYTPAKQNACSDGPLPKGTRG